ncbi:uncharacterized protein LOC108052537 [Drosophila rhopaloa]|uniref:Uncharacterized protein LOC108052537 n=1 Tax=Drosophila rhopaloa TaxID=1041015 RepID=A0A6P4FS10_DRORH|nr:uncharacterized protein LOC108052537 [Drosophila rhopaloa]
MMIIQTEFIKIDDALEICYSMEDDLHECLGLVKTMNRKYNAPGRYTISMDPFAEDYPLYSPESTEQDASSLQNADSELEMLSQLYGARSAQELDESYVDVRYKFIKLKRDLEGTVTHCQRITDCADRQERVSHRMLKSSGGSKKRLCKH